MTSPDGPRRAVGRWQYSVRAPGARQPSRRPLGRPSAIIHRRDRIRDSTGPLALPRPKVILLIVARKFHCPSAHAD